MDRISPRQCADGEDAAPNFAAAHDLAAYPPEPATAVKMGFKADFCSPKPEKWEKDVVIQTKLGRIFIAFWRELWYERRRPCG